jgi:hypothetical protein
MNKYKSLSVKRREAFLIFIKKYVIIYIESERKEMIDMVVKYVWWKYKNYHKEKYCEGWFLFGVIPIYIRSRFVV